MTNENRHKEIAHVNKALRNSSYPDWALIKGAAQPQQHDHTEREKGKTTCCITLLYIRELADELCRIFRDHRCSTNFKLGNTLWQLLVPTISCKERRDL